MNQKLMLDAVWNGIDTPPRLESFERIPSMAIIQECLDNMFDTAELFFIDDFFSHLYYETNRQHNQRIIEYKVPKEALK